MIEPVNIFGLKIIEIIPSTYGQSTNDFIAGHYKVEPGTKLRCDLCHWEGDSSELIVEELPYPYEKIGNYKFCTTCPGQGCDASTGNVLHEVSKIKPI